MVQNNLNKKGILYQLAASIIAVLLAVSDGMQFGWTSPIAPILLKEDSHLKVTKTDIEWLETILVIGLFCGLPFTVYTVNKIGQKKSLILACFVNLAVWITIAVANKIEYIIVARFFYGMSNNMTFVAGPMYIAEIADKNIRGLLSNIIYLLTLLGTLVIYSITEFVPFYVPSIVAGVVLLTEIILFPFMPDSPYYLLCKGKVDEAKKSLQRLRRRKNIDEEFEEINAAVKRQTCDTKRYRDIVLVNSNRKALIIMLVLNFAQHFSGISVMFMNVQSVFEKTGSTLIGATYSAIVFCSMMFLSSILACYTVDKYGRKILLITSSILTGLSLLVLSIYLQLEVSNIDVSHISWLPLVSIIVYAISFKLGLGTIPIILTAEIFPTNMKAIGMTLADCSYGLSSVVSLQIYYLLSDSIGMQGSFLLFALVCFVTAVFSVLYIPETKGKTLEEIQLMLRNETPVVSSSKDDFVNK